MADPLAEQLAARLLRDRDTILRHWARELRATAHDLPRGEFETRLAPLVDELARALDRGEDAPRAFAAAVADLGARRFIDGVGLRSAARELLALHGAILSVELPAPFAALLACTLGEALVAVAAEHARAARIELVRFRESTVLAALRRHLETGVIVVHRDGVVALASDALESIFGVPASALAGQPLVQAAAALLGPVHARALDGQPLGWRQLPLGRVFERSADVASQTFRVRHALSGQELLCESAAFTVEEAGLPGGLLALFRDVTSVAHQAEELVRADRELAALHARLLRRHHQQAIGDLAASTSLALNNELNAIKLSLPLLRAALSSDGCNTPAVARHFEAMEAAVARGAARVGELQALAARRGGPGPWSIRALDLNQAVVAALDLVRPELTAAATDRSVRVDARLGRVPPVRAEAAELRELLCTVIVDARDRLPQDGVLQVATRQEGDRAVLTLSHAGDRALDDEEQRLTLAGAAEAARRWGGELVLESGPGRSTVRLTIPIAAARLAESPAGAAVEPTHIAPTPGGRRVLVVDDDAGNRETLGELLLLTGHQADAFATAAGALAAAAAQPYDAALVDLAMPEMNGWEIARRLRADHPRMRIAIVTGWEPDATAGRAPPGTVDALFRKPIDLPAIQAFLAREEAQPPAPRHP